MKPRLLVDIDNCLAASDAVFRRLIREVHGVDLRYEDVVRYSYADCADAAGRRRDPAWWDAIHDRFSLADVLVDIAPVDGALGALRRLSALGFSIHLVTARLAAARAGTVAWLERHGVPADGLHFARAAKHIALAPAFAAVEDDFDQACAYAAAGTPCYLIPHPWNARPTPGGVTRVAGWADLVGRFATPELVP